MSGNAIKCPLSSQQSPETFKQGFIVGRKSNGHRWLKGAAVRKAVCSVTATLL